MAKKTSFLSVKLTPEIKESLESTALKFDTTKSFLTQQAIKQFLYTLNNQSNN